MSRRPDIERRWLSEIVEEAGCAEPAEFLDAVGARLQKGAAEYGETFLAKPFTELVDEAREEGADLPGWLLLAVQRFQLDRHNMPEAAALQIERILILAAARAVQSYQLLGMVTEVYDANITVPPDPPYSKCST